MRRKRNTSNGLLGICILILLSCAMENTYCSNKQSKLYTINFDTLKVKPTFCYSNIFDSVSIIELDNSQVMIGRIDKMDVYKDKFIVLDENQAKGVFVFDKRGKLLRKIGSIGPGPKEYTACTDFAIDSQSGIIYIYDWFRKIIHVYNIDTGNYLRNIKFDIDFHRIWCNNGILYAVNTSFISQKSKGRKYILSRLDVNSGHETQRWMDIDQYNKGWQDELTSSSLFYHVNDGKDLFAFGFSDTIMCINNGKVIPYMAFSGDKVIKPSDILEEEKAEALNFKKRIEMRLRLGNKLGKITGVLNIFQYNNFLFFGYTTWPLFLGICDLNTNEVSTYANFKDDVLFSSSQFLHRTLPSFLVSDRGGVYYCIGTDYLLELKNHFKEGYLSNKIKNRKILEGLDEDSNPVIVYYEFKQ